MAKPTDVERIKESSEHLRGSLAESLVDPITGGLAEDDTQLSKFHGIYQQDDRDLRSERKRQRLEPAYSFMIRARVPAGICTPSQWLAMDRLAREAANGSIRLTTRQAFQLHGVIKRDLKNTIRGINESLLDTLAACGDVNRNVMAPTLHEFAACHQRVSEDAQRLSDHLTPQTRAYHEIWLDGEKTETGNEPEVEPIYGKTYLPRKFKTAFVIPPTNDTDVFAQDLGFVAIIENGELLGYNVTVGGGMGMTHGETQTFPRTADQLGFCRPNHVNAIAEAVVTTQRDYGDRTNRKHARLKYTIEDRGIDWFREEVQRRAEIVLSPPKPAQFITNGDAYGWRKDDAGAWSYTMFVENGRVADGTRARPLTALREIAELNCGEFRLTPNQNVAICGLTDDQKRQIDQILNVYGLRDANQVSPLRLHSMACVAMPTCGLAMAESERYLPLLVTRIESELEQLGIADQPITIRMTGCPNGCARPYIAEIGLVGKGPGRYNLYLGANFFGSKLGALYLENGDEDEILTALRPLLTAYAKDRRIDERFGDFLRRVNLVADVAGGADFHAAGERNKAHDTA